MAKLEGFKNVAVIKQCGRDYHYALYNDGFEYKPGDTVLVSNNKEQWEISEIITPEEAAERFKKNITGEVVCKIDVSAYKSRVEKRKEADKIKKKMDEIVRSMDEFSKYTMYAEQNPELKEMLDNYKSLVY